MARGKGQSQNLVPESRFIMLHLLGWENPAPNPVLHGYPYTTNLGPG